MGTSVVPQLIDALVSNLTTALAGKPVIVTDGYGVTDDPSDFLMVGIEDPTNPASGTSATAQQTYGPSATTRPRNQTGVVWLAAYSWNGNADAGGQKQARDAAYSYVAAVENLLRNNPNLGIAPGGNFVAQMGDVERLLQSQDANGTEAGVIFNVSFFARI